MGEVSWLPFAQEISVEKEEEVNRVTFAILSPAPKAEPTQFLRSLC